MIRKIKITTAALLLLFNSNLFAQTATNPWTVGLGIGIMEYNGDAGNCFFSFTLSPTKVGSGTFVPGVGQLYISHYYNQNFDWSALAHWGSMGGLLENNTSYVTRNSRGIEGNIRWKFLHKDQARFIPYLFTGLGFRNQPEVVNKKGDLNTNNELILPFGVGVNIKLSERMMINIQSNIGLSSSDDFDGRKSGFTDMSWTHAVGLSYMFGKSFAKPADTDADGVLDNKDKCPQTKKGALVDEDGCLLDKDKDNVADNFDKCPDIAGLERFEGCPDSDGDGVQDSEDKCPDVVGLPKFSGCPNGE